MGLENAAWALGLYFACLWCLLLNYSIRPGPISAGRFLFCGLFTSLVGIALLLAAQNLPGIRTLYAATKARSLPEQVVGYVLGVGILEEATKLLPLYWLFVHRKEPTTPREAAFLGCVSGLSFGVTEAVMYSLRYALGLRSGALGFGDYLVVQVLRLISLPLLHALWAGVTGYFVGLAAAVPSRSRALIVIGLGITALIHGLYDVNSDSWIGVLIGVISLLVFVAYARSAEYVVANLGPAPARRSAS
jgi:RsiW-degrading membrane proteinase PrsW (M82 family)